ncbi:transcriptional repressor LexA [Sphingosinicella sp.]|jgi:repressor LexA|uniref:transcriptional repressor LexA n=1 Tax=Sphingosinicella sp. TaxID=1917971 RepID=UPI00180C753A|nr:transcriptional repressor LexA [Sphingosinicella sp.]MBA4757193.1 transcriptional repressor LexA [Sphingosinicella sp.]MEA3537999.1 transcriptional repressor LexA [Pseudomonadota bacterium]
MLTRKQHELLMFINDRLQAGGVSPSFEEMKEALDLKSKSGVHRLVNALEERQFIRRLPNRARALEVLRFPETGTAPKAPLRQMPVVQAANDDIITLPLHGKIAAGMPIEAMESDRSLSVPAALLGGGSGDHFALEVSGDSMIEAGILDGDYALVQKCDTARDGEIVVALVDEDEATLKYLRRDKGEIRLDPANSAYTAQRYAPNRVRVQGKLVGLLRRYN